MSAHQTLFGETQTIIRSNVKRFVDAEIKPHINTWEEANVFPRELYEKAGAAGILGIGHPEEFGGVEADVFSKIAATEEILRAGSGGLAASLGSIDIGLPPVWKWGSEALKQKIVPDVIAGKKLAP